MGLRRKYAIFIESLNKCTNHCLIDLDMMLENHHTKALKNVQVTIEYEE